MKVEIMAKHQTVIDLEEKGVENLSFLNDYTKEQCAAIIELNLNTNPGLKSIQGIEKLPNLQIVDIGGTEVSDLSPLLPLANKLIALRLTNAPIGQDQVPTISQMGQLQELHANSNDNEGKINDISAWSCLTGLTVLSIDGNSGIDKLDALASLTNLTELGISGTGAKKLDCVGSLKRLQSLNIQGMNVNAQDLAPLTKLPALNELYLDDELKVWKDKILRQANAQNK